MAAPITKLPTTKVKKLARTNAQYKQDRRAKWLASGKPKMADWVKAGTGHRGLAGKQQSGLLKQRLGHEKDAGKREAMMGGYDRWLDAGRPKMAEWVKMGAGADPGLKKLAANKLARGTK